MMKFLENRFTKIKNRLLNFCLSSENIQIGNLYERYRSNCIQGFDDGQLKFIGESMPDNLLIRTGSGLISPIKRILRTVKYHAYRVTLDNGFNIECADKHKLMDWKGDEIFAIDSLGCYLQTELGISHVIRVDKIPDFENMYDLELDGFDHTYHTNGILSHNTTMAAAYFLWYASFKDDKTILIVSNNMSNASEFIHRVRSFYEELPMWLKPGVRRDGWSKTSVGFDTGSRIISRATSESSARGLALSLVFADELAFVRESIANEFWTSLSPVLATGGSMIIASTPDGDSNLFARLSLGAELCTNDFKHYKYIWSDVPERDEKWKRTQIGLLGPEKFKQEHEVEFLSSKATLVSSITLQQQITVKQPINVLKSFSIYKEFEPGKKYIIGADPSTGTGSDFTVMEVFEFPAMIQVCEFRDNLTSSKYAYIALKSLIQMIESKGAEVYYSIENNGVGEGMLSLMDNDDNISESAEFITQDGSKRPGFTTTNRHKMKACLTLRDMLEEGSITLQSNNLLVELKNFIRTGKGYSAKEGSTDDCISAVLIVLRILDELIQYDDDAFEMMANKLEGDYFNDDNESSDAMPMVF